METDAILQIILGYLQRAGQEKGSTRINAAISQ